MLKKGFYYYLPPIEQYVFVKRLKCCFLGYEIGDSTLKTNVISPLFLPSDVSIHELVGFRPYVS